MTTADSNIYVSAFRFGRRPMDLLELAACGEINIAVSDAIVSEVLRVLRDRFGFSDERIDEIRDVIERCTTRVVPTRTINAVPSDPDDNRILE